MTIHNVLHIGGPADGQRKTTQFAGRIMVVPVHEYVLRGISFPSFRSHQYKLTPIFVGEGDNCLWIAVSEEMTFKDAMLKLIDNYKPSEPVFEEKKYSRELSEASSIINAKILAFGATDDEKAKYEIHLRTMAREQGIEMDKPVYCEEPTP